MFDVVMAAPRSLKREMFKAVCPLPILAKGTHKLSEKSEVATAILRRFLIGQMTLSGAELIHEAELSANRLSGIRTL